MIPLLHRFTTWLTGNRAKTRAEQQPVQPPLDQAEAQVWADMPTTFHGTNGKLIPADTEVRRQLFLSLLAEAKAAENQPAQPAKTTS